MFPFINENRLENKNFNELPTIFVTIIFYE